METNETEVINSTNDTEKTENQETVEETVETEESVDVLKKKVATLEAQKNHWKEKAEKPKPPAVKEDSVSLSIKDTIALRDVPEEDVDFIVNYAKSNNLTVGDAKKNKFVQVYLREVSEERQTAAATATKGRRSMTKDTPEEIVNRASKGILPEDDEGIAKLAEAHQQLKLKKLQN